MKASTIPKTEMVINLWVCMVAVANLLIQSELLHHLFMFTAWLALIILVLAICAVIDGAEMIPEKSNKINQILTLVAVILLVVGLVVTGSPFLAAGITVSYAFLSKIYYDERKEDEYADYN